MSKIRFYAFCDEEKDAQDANIPGICGACGALVPGYNVGVLAADGIMPPIQLHTDWHEKWDRVMVVTP